MKAALEVLQKHWGYTHFKPGQQEAVCAARDKEDSFVLLPTSGGKSVCYQLPTLLQKGLCLVVTPLISLMEDQVNALKKKNIKALAIHGQLNHEEVSQLLDNVVYGKYMFLYMSPERLHQEWMVERLASLPLTLIAIDEAHCVSQWGHDFRPSYLLLAKVCDLWPGIPKMALTATATPRVQNEIIEFLALKNPKIIKTPIARPNLHYSVQKTNDKIGYLVRLLSKADGNAIIYTRNRKTTEQLAHHLNKLGLETAHYHGGLTPNEKQKQMQSWMLEKSPIMVATTAFGMGIDKENVRQVIHVSLPESLESYFQETGRAGRDGKTAQVTLLLGPADENNLKKQFLEAIPVYEDVYHVYRKLCNYLQIAFGEGAGQRFDFHFGKFCDAYQLNKMKTFQCFKILDREDLVAFSEVAEMKTKLKFNTTKENLFQYIDQNPTLGVVVSLLLRHYPGILDFSTVVDTAFLSRITQLPREKINQCILQIKKDQLIDLENLENDVSLIFLHPREDESSLHPLGSRMKMLKKLKENQIKEVIRFVNNGGCYSQFLTNYFGETLKHACGNCSNCLTKKQENKAAVKKVIEESILELLDSGAQNSQKIVKLLPYQEADVIRVLDRLLDLEKIVLNSNKEYQLK